ncbi:hypothetical protein LYSHEL_22990 [Lysobacter helvus]|uniref:Uncharacterized protein n=2 Tax=Lysobacteraceae TaxID=32033 RepID=A0ABN6FUH0_9GAMM|nr:MULTISPECIES: hypothetical protein [Lysobacter]BCT93275.1 hypothetical protein LYSCAS_22990 [Lysobacter caseinilyticus]BCT96428.1 hypothetical protein LYSHEL_22990 [Lysobacter helvus]
MESARISSLVHFLDWLARTTPLFLAFVALLAFYYREKIKQVLSRALMSDLEELKSRHARELAAHTASLERELEAYKVSLIAETERIRAAQEIKKALALRVAERKFVVVANLLEAHMGIDTNVGAQMIIPQSNGQANQSVWNDDRQALIKRFSAYASAASAAKIFVSADVNLLNIEVRKLGAGLMNRRPSVQTPPLSPNDPELRDLLMKSSQLEALLLAALQEMEQLT